MTPNLTELMQPILFRRKYHEEARRRLDAAEMNTRDLANELDSYIHSVDAYEALLARLLSVIRCQQEGCVNGLVLKDPSKLLLLSMLGSCPKCGPDRAAIEKMQP